MNDPRFWAKTVLAESGCIEWVGAHDRHGYGFVHRGGRNHSTHRYVMEQAGVDISGYLVLHHCDNPPCVNRDHLFVGTPQDNMIDMARKGRGGKGGNLKQGEVEEIRRLRELGVRTGLVAKMFRVSPSSVCLIVARKNYAWVD